MDFYTETKWCPQCKTYVRYMMSVNASYCAACGAAVRLFNKEDLERFNDDMEKRRWKAS
jgi:hypothetical protein